jgi:hypothetical protein
MRHRCLERTNPAWDDYGGRGITICARWVNSPANFLSDVGPRPRGHEIDRRDNNGGYWCGKCDECIALGRPANCRWVTRKVNDRNRRGNRMVPYKGEERVVTELAETFGLRPDTLRERLAAGWDLEMALTQPARPKRERQRTTRLSDEEVRELRALRDNGASLTDLAVRFSITGGMVSMIARRKAYQHVA